MNKPVSGGIVKDILIVQYVLQNRLWNSKILLSHKNIDVFISRYAEKELGVKKEAFDAKNNYGQFLIDHFLNPLEFRGQVNLIKLEILQSGRVLSFDEFQRFNQLVTAVIDDGYRPAREYAKLLSQFQHADFLEIDYNHCLKLFMEALEIETYEQIISIYDDNFSSVSEVFPSDQGMNDLQRLSKAYLDIYSMIDISKPNYGWENLGFMMGYYVRKESVLQDMKTAQDIFSLFDGPSSQHAKLLRDKEKDIDVVIGMAISDFYPYNEIHNTFMHGINDLYRKLIFPKELFVSNTTINAGNIGNLNTGTQIIGGSVNNGFSLSSKELSEIFDSILTVIRNQENQSDELLKSLNDLKEQCELPCEERLSRGGVRKLYDSTSQLLSGVANIGAVWSTFGPIIARVLGVG